METSGGVCFGAVGNQQPNSGATDHRCSCRDESFYFISRSRGVPERNRQIHRSDEDSIHAGNRRYGGGIFDTCPAFHHCDDDALQIAVADVVPHERTTVTAGTWRVGD